MPSRAPPASIRGSWLAFSALPPSCCPKPSSGIYCRARYGQGARRYSYQEIVLCGFVADGKGRAIAPAYERVETRVSGLMKRASEDGIAMRYECESRNLL
ncbi:hypothetical protein BCV69DRAFT_116890 [Microstroma glucosiphilum]|uniref:Uncharacterized protein n=1 Tax=Pseudomicrostroma glucosiphilum TaxID=1684307 RepID=A0A316UJG8_9BASI|nr:hypothetical protein BCV69DRAFT_116890 [Pseudomicrostroma glucosiphilum]PWN23355.1 hypothetical protein BCV69DRAFT_116890 [Pseudomicrostroma glucosiphilum]